jgi:hypothetical protein
MDEPEDNGDDCPSLALSSNGITADEEGCPTVVVEVGLLLPLRMLDSEGLPSSTAPVLVVLVVRLCIFVPKWGKGDRLIMLSAPVCEVDHGDIGLFQVGSIDRGSIWDAFDELGRSASDVD